MAAVELAKSAEDLRREIEELHRQQREVCLLLLLRLLVLVHFPIIALIKKLLDLTGIRRESAQSVCGLKLLAGVGVGLICFMGLVAPTLVQ
jgi:hypothetical protein